MKKLKEKGEQLKKSRSQDTITRSNIEPMTGKIVSVQDLKNSKYLDIDVAEKMGIIDFLNGTFKNTASNEELKISEAISKIFV